MDELLEKKLRSLKLKLAIAEKELQASSGKWKLGALLGAGHASAMNREVVKLKDRLEGKIEKLKSEIDAIVGVVPQSKKTTSLAKESPTRVKESARTEPNSKPDKQDKKASASKSTQKEPAKKSAAPSKKTAKSAPKKSLKK